MRIGTNLQDTVTFAAPFLVGDVIKVFVAGVAASAVHRAYPALLGTTRVATESRVPAPADGTAAHAAS